MPANGRRDLIRLLKFKSLNEYYLQVSPSGSDSLPLFCLRVVFSIVGGHYCTNNVPRFYHTLIVFMVHFTVFFFECSLHQLKRFYFFLLSLRTSSLLSNSWVSSTLMWWRSLPSCFLVNLPSSFVTISIWRSLWITAFMIYQGASTMFLRTVGSRFTSGLRSRIFGCKSNSS